MKYNQNRFENKGRSPLVRPVQSSSSTAEAFPRLLHLNSNNTSSVDPKLPNESMILPSDHSSNKENFAAVLKNQEQSSFYKTMVDPIPVKKVEYHNGIPRVSWTEKEVERMNIIKNLQYAVIGKFSNEWPELEDLLLAIPTKCNVKGECTIGLIRNRHVLFRLENQEDIVNLMSCLLH